MQCVILAGGLGTRIKHLHDAIPKALVQFNSKPFLYYQLKALAAGGITDVVLCIGHKGDLIRDYVGDGGKWGLRVEYTHEGANLKGTGGALRLALDEDKLQDSFFVIYGDSFLPMDYRQAWDFFLHSGKPALLTIFKNNGQWDTSNVSFNQGILLYDKEEGLKHPNRFQYIDYGLSAFHRSVIETRIPSGVKADLATLIHQLSVEHLVAGLEIHTRFYEIGSPRGIEDFQHSSYVQNSGESC